MVEIIFAEFGKEVDTENVRQYFPEAKITILNEKNCPSIFPYDQRWGHRMNDYYKVKGLADSEEDIAICFDGDMRIISKQVEAIIPLVRKFGLCLPENPRGQVIVDTIRGTDSDGILDETGGTAQAVNMSPIAFNPIHPRAWKVLSCYLDIMRNNPVRGPLAMWRAIWQSGFMPCILPLQWCVCGENVGIGGEVILHIGHPEVRKHYGF